VREERGNVFAIRTLKKRLHDFLALCSREIAALGFHDLHVRKFRNYFLETFLTIDRWRGAGRADQFGDDGLTVRGLGKPVASPAAFLNEIRSDEGHVERVIRDFYRSIAQNDERREYPPS
jgi:hypothetical protein